MRNEKEYYCLAQESMGEAAPNYEAAAFMALEADVRELLQAGGRWDVARGGCCAPEDEEGS